MERRQRCQRPGLVAPSDPAGLRQATVERRQRPAVVLMVPASRAAVLWMVQRRQRPAVVLMVPASRAAVLWMALGAVRVSRGMLRLQRRQRPAIVLMVPASRAAVHWIELGALLVSRSQQPASRAALL